MNGSQEHPDVPMQPPTLPETPAAAPLVQTAPPPPSPPPAAPTYAAPPQTVASHVAPTHVGPAQGLQHKSPFIACALSLMPGVGQIYVGYYRLGFIHNIVFASTIMILNFRLPDAMYPLLGIFLAFFFIYNVVDAGRRAMYYNLALDGVEGIELPSMNLSVPGFGGSLGGGLTLIGVGVVLLSNTLFDVPLEWIESWWPIAPILFGVYLLVKAIQERASGTPSAGTAAENPPTDSLDTDSSSFL